MHEVRRPDSTLPASAHTGGALSSFDLGDRIRRILDDGTPDNTRLAYESDLRYVRAWCEATGLPTEIPMPLEDVVRFLVDHVDGQMPPHVEHALVQAGVKAGYGKLAISTVTRRFMALSMAHNRAARGNPCTDKRVREILRRGRKAALRTGWRPAKKVAAHREILDQLLDACGDDIVGLRDRAVLLFAFSSGGRRASEVSTAEVDRLEPVKDDFVYNLGLTKTDKDDEAGAIPVAGRAARAVEAWLAASRIVDGALFRGIDRWGTILPDKLSPRGVRRIVKRRAAEAGLDPNRFGAHSLRSGFITETGFQGIALGDAMKLSRHKSVEVAMGYHQAGAGLNNKAARVAG